MEKAKSTITEGLSESVDTWCSKHGIDKSVLKEWKDKVIHKVVVKINTLFNKTSLKFHKSVLDQVNPLNTLNDIHSQFFVTPPDKANGKVAFICQRLNAFVLIKELRLDHNNTGTNNAYFPVHKTNNQVISGHTTFLRNKFNLVVDEENKKNPNTYWTHKLHKHPYKARFIIVAPQ